jgi:hypothetical protein
MTNLKHNTVWGNVSDNTEVMFGPMHLEMV